MFELLFMILLFCEVFHENLFRIVSKYLCENFYASFSSVVLVFS